MAACIHGLSPPRLSGGTPTELSHNLPSTSASPVASCRSGKPAPFAFTAAVINYRRNCCDYSTRSCSPAGLGSSFWRQESYPRFREQRRGRHRGALHIAGPVLTVVLKGGEMQLASMESNVVAKLAKRLDARLFGPAIFEASKLCVLFLGVDQEKHPEQVPRSYTLTHSDITAEITLAVAREINKAQLRGWYRRLQRDEVLAEWRKAKGQMSLHVHCHISGGHWLLNLIAKIRFYIFRKELPVVLEAFMHGDRALFEKHPDLAKAPVWVYFHSNTKEYNRVENWGPLNDATQGYSPAAKKAIHDAANNIGPMYAHPICPAPLEFGAHLISCLVEPGQRALPDHVALRANLTWV